MLGNKRPSKIKIHLEEKLPDDASVVAYGFDARGNLIGTSQVGGDGSLDLKKLDRATRVFLGPAPAKGGGGREKPTLKSLERQRAFELAPSLETVFVPKDIIACWRWCLCLIRGHVYRSVSVGGSTVDMPVCNARVHICEVDPWYIFIDKIPYEVLLYARDVILGREQFRIPPRWIPDPPPVERGLRVQTQTQGMAETATASQAMTAAASTRREAIEAKSTLSVKEAVQQIPAEVKLAMSTDSEIHLRQAFVLHKPYIYQLLCYWPWWWHLYCDEIDVVDTGADGSFIYPYFYLCGDHPDLYFWVEYQINGMWEAVYNPPIACNTWWNYPCGTDVTIRITDPRVPYCDPGPLFPGSVVVVTTLGGGINMSRIDQLTGLIDGRPFGGELEPHVDFGAALRNSANQYYYRWSWRQAGSTDDFQAIHSPIYRRYLIEYNDPTIAPAYGAEQLGPLSAPGSNLFKIPRVDAPAVADATTTWTVLYPRPDTASAIFHTQDDIGFTSRSVELKLELFDHTGARVNWDTAGIADYVIDPSVVTPPSTGTIATVPATAYRVMDSGHVVGLHFLLQVDNNRCTADILPLEAPGLIVDADCGFYKYAHTTDHVTLKYVASHPHNFATFTFDVAKGPGNSVAGVNVSGARVGADAPPYSLVSGVYSSTPPAPTVAALLGTCPAAAFSEALSVYSMATDGWGGPGNLNAFDHGAFALAPQ